MIGEKLPSPLNRPEIQNGWAVNDSIEQQLGSFALELLTGPRQEIMEAAYPLEAVKSWQN